MFKIISSLVLGSLALRQERLILFLVLILFHLLIYEPLNIRICLFSIIIRVYDWRSLGKTKICRSIQNDILRLNVDQITKGHQKYYRNKHHFEESDVHHCLSLVYGFEICVEALDL